MDRYGDIIGGNHVIGRELGYFIDITHIDTILYI
jgi:hypothetical protein